MRTGLWRSENTTDLIEITNTKITNLYAMKIYSYLVTQKLQLKILIQEMI